MMASTGPCDETKTFVYSCTMHVLTSSSLFSVKSNTKTVTASPVDCGKAPQVTGKHQIDINYITVKALIKAPLKNKYDPQRHLVRSEK